MPNDTSNIKKITMHPYNSDGSIDPTISVYPNIKLDNIKEDASDDTSVSLQRKITIGEDSSNFLSLDETTNELEFNLNFLIVQIIKTIYPIGSIFSTFDTDLTKGPNDYLAPSGITLDMYWEPIEDTFLYAAVQEEHTATGDYKVGDAGGDKDAVILKHKHTASFSGVHATLYHNSGWFDIRRVYGNEAMVYNSNGICTLSRGLNNQSTVNREGQQQLPDRVNINIPAHDYTPTGTVTVSDLSAGTASVGGYADDKTGKNMPPYTAIRMWKRVSNA